MAATGDLQSLLTALNTSDAGTVYRGVLRLAAAAPLLLHQYLESSPEAEELFALWETQAQTRTSQLAVAIHKALDACVRHAEGTAHSAALAIARRILKHKLKIIYSNLSSGHVPAIKATLALLEALVLRGPSIAREMHRTFDFSLKALSTIAQRGANKHTPKPYFIRFALAFLRTGEGPVIEDLLKGRTLFGSVLRGLHTDPSPLVHLVITSLHQHVLLNPEISTWSKTFFFNSFALEKLALLYDRETADAELAHSFLYDITCSPTTSVVHPQRDWGASSGTHIDKLRNRGLVRFLRCLRPSENLPQQRLVLALLKRCPELIHPYTSFLSIAIDPRPSLRWHTNAAFLAKLISLPLPPLGHEPPDDPTLIVESLIPPLLTKSTFSHGLQCNNGMVKYTVVGIMIRILQKLALLLSDIASRDDVQEAHLPSPKRRPWETFVMRVVEAVRRSFPDFQVVLSLRQYFAGTGKDDRHRPLAWSRFLRLLVLYEDVLPQVLLEARFDPLKIASSDHSQLDFLSQYQLIELLSRASQNGRMLHQSKGYNALSRFLALFTQTASSVMHAHVRRLLLRIVGEMAPAESDPGVAELWLDWLDECTAPFLERVLHRTARTCAKGVDEDSALSLFDGSSIIWRSALLEVAAQDSDAAKLSFSYLANVLRGLVFCTPKDKIAALWGFLITKEPGETPDTFFLRVRSNSQIDRFMKAALGGLKVWLPRSLVASVSGKREASETRSNLVSMFDLDELSPIPGAKEHLRRFALPLSLLAEREEKVLPFSILLSLACNVCSERMSSSVHRAALCLRERLLVSARTLPSHYVPLAIQQVLGRVSSLLAVRRTEAISSNVRLEMALLTDLLEVLPTSAHLSKSVVRVPSLAECFVHIDLPPSRNDLALLYAVDHLLQSYRVDPCGTQEALIGLANYLIQGIQNCIKNEADCRRIRLFVCLLHSVLVTIPSCHLHALVETMVASWHGRPDLVRQALSSLVLMVAVEVSPNASIPSVLVARLGQETVKDLVVSSDHCDTVVAVSRLLSISRSLLDVESGHSLDLGLDIPAVIVEQCLQWPSPQGGTLLARLVSDNVAHRAVFARVCATLPAAERTSECLWWHFDDIVEWLKAVAHASPNPFLLPAVEEFLPGVSCRHTTALDAIHKRIRKEWKAATKALRRCWLPRLLGFLLLSPEHVDRISDMFPSGCGHEALSFLTRHAPSVLGKLFAMKTPSKNLCRVLGEHLQHLDRDWTSGEASVVHILFEALVHREKKMDLLQHLPIEDTDFVSSVMDVVDWAMETRDKGDLLSWIRRTLAGVCTRGGTPPVSDVRQRIIEHPHFLELWSPRTVGVDDMRLELAKLLLFLCKNDGSKCDAKSLLTLLVGYNASMSPVDRMIREMLPIHEEHGIRLDEAAFVWGQRSLDRLKGKEAEPVDGDVWLTFADTGRILSSITHFWLCDSKKYDEEDEPDEEDEEEIRREIYDPTFVYPLLAYLLSKSSVDVRRFVETRTLGFVLCGLSASNEGVRRLAYRVLALFMPVLESRGTDFRERQQIIALLHVLRNSVTQPYTVLPGLVTAFLSRAILLQFRPEQEEFLPVNRFVLREPFLPVSEVPMFDEVFLQQSPRRLRWWVLRFLAAGLYSYKEYSLLQRRGNVRQLLAYWSAPTTDPRTRLLILGCLQRAAVIPFAARDILSHQGTLSWFRAVCELEHPDSSFFLPIVKIASTLVQTFPAGGGNLCLTAEATLWKVLKWGRTRSGVQTPEFRSVCEHVLRFATSAVKAGGTEVSTNPRALPLSPSLILGFVKLLSQQDYYAGEVHRHLLTLTTVAITDTREYDETEEDALSCLLDWVLQCTLKSPEDTSTRTALHWHNQWILRSSSLRRRALCGGSVEILLLLARREVPTIVVLTLCLLASEAMKHETSFLSLPAPLLLGTIRGLEDVRTTKDLHNTVIQPLASHCWNSWDHTCPLFRVLVLSLRIFFHVLRTKGTAEPPVVKG